MANRGVRRLRRAISPAAGLIASAAILRFAGGGASSSTSDEYLRGFHDSEYPLRWRAFVADHEPFLRSNSASYLEKIRKDHGYNPPPVWTMTGKVFSSFGTAVVVVSFMISSSSRLA